MVKSGLNPFVVLVAGIAALGGFLFGFDSSIVADIQDQVSQQLALTTWQWSEVVSISLVGSIIGIPFSGLVTDRLSRRTLLKAVAVGFIIGTACCALAYEFYTLLIGRFIIGLCIGICSYTAPLFIAEIAPPKRRGTLILINGLAITFGQTVAYLLGYLLHDSSASSWRLLLWLGLVPASLLFIGMFLVPHSPRWVMKKSGAEATRALLKKIRVSTADIQFELDEIDANLKHSRVTIKKLLKPPVSYLLLFGIALGVFQQLSGINAIMFYGPMIFQSSGLVTVKNAILAIFWISLINFICTLTTSYLIDRLGRRILLLTGTLIAACSLFAMSGFYHFISSGSHPLWMMLFMTTYVIGYCISLGSLFWVMIAEIYPGKVRGLAMSIATLMHWVANFLVSISFLSFLEDLGEVTVFTFFALMCLAAYLVIYFFAPETRGLSLEKLEHNLAYARRIRDIGQPLGSSSTTKSLDLTMENMQ